jgi:Tfp pilus assembly protein PilF
LIEALGHFQKAVKARPDWADAHNNIGIVQKMQGRDGDAMRSFSPALNARADPREAAENVERLKRMTASGPS